jgi:hypothetical protein
VRKRPETNRIHLVLFAMQDRIFGPYLTAIHRTLISAMHDLGAPFTAKSLGMNQEILSPPPPKHTPARTRAAATWVLSQRG